MDLKKEIVVVGSCMIDFVSYAPRLPKAGETIHGSKFVTTFGGKGANQCVAAAKLGGNTTLVARVGDDLWGEKYKENLNKYQVNTENVLITKNSSSGIAQINVSDNGENQIVIVAGANSELSVKDIDNVKSIVNEAAVLVLQLETSQSVALRALELCRGISILNGAPALTDYDPKLLKLPTFFCVNESEAFIFTGLSVTNKIEAENAARKLKSQGCKNVIITLGAQGAVFLGQDKDECFFIDSPSVKSVDSTGAGDSFIGALAYLLVNDKELDIVKCIEGACKAAADSVTRRGTQVSFPGPEIFQLVNILPCQKK